MALTRQNHVFTTILQLHARFYSVLSVKQLTATPSRPVYQHNATRVWRACRHLRRTRYVCFHSASTPHNLSATQLTPQHPILESIDRLLATIFKQRDWDSLRRQLESLEERLKDSSLWDDPTSAIQLQKQASSLQGQLSEYDRLRSRRDSCVELLDLAREENDDAMMTEIDNDLQVLEQDVKKYYVGALLNGPNDGDDCFIEIRAGMGGVDAQGFVSRLARMYTLWATKTEMDAKVISESKGELNGYKSVTLSISGPYAYGFLKHEIGVHRLVQMSKTDSANRRMTCFASVSVLPNSSSDDVSKNTIDIPAGDIKIETMRSQGAGGQHVNKTESAVRITHIPTGITVTCQNERSQHQNKAAAMSLLKSKLYERELRAKMDAKSAVYAALPENSFGSQIRSYVLHPYQLVKDLRTGYEVQSAEKVFEGDITSFLESAVCHFAMQKDDNT